MCNLATFSHYVTCTLSTFALIHPDNSWENPSLLTTSVPIPFHQCDVTDIDGAHLHQCDVTDIDGAHLHQCDVTDIDGAHLHQCDVTDVDGAHLPPV